MGALSDETDYVVENALDTDVPEIMEFLRLHADPRTRQLSEEDVRARIADDGYYVARCGRDFEPPSKGGRAYKKGEIVGAAYFRTESPEKFELCGALLAKEHRKSGLSYCLGTMVLVAPYLHDSELPFKAGSKKIEALVLPKNEAMIAILEKSGFRQLSDRELVPDEGTKHMLEAGGSTIILRAYEFDENVLPVHIQRAIEYRDRRKLPDTQYTVQLNIPHWQPTEGRDALSELLSEVSTSRTPGKKTRTSRKK